MIQLFSILVATVVLLGFSTSVGRALLARTRIALLPLERLFFEFLLGATCLAGLVFVLRTTSRISGTIALLNPAVFLLLAAGIAYFAYRNARTTPLEVSLPPTPRLWNVAFWVALVIFGFLYLSLALAPETSVDGTTYYLNQVADSLRPPGSQDDLSNAFPGAATMLLLFMYVAGNGSGVGLVSFFFLLATAIGILSFGRRFGEPAAGALAAVLVFASPIVGILGTIAVPDVWISGMLLGVFYAAKLAHAQRNRGMFWVSVVLFFSLASTMTPWLLREFAKPLLHWNGFYGGIPLELTVHGARLNGLLGPVFLLTPLALLSLGKPVGRQLALMGIIFAAPCLGGMETRALVPGLPFLSLAMAMTLVRWRLAAQAVLVAHLAMSWPALARLYVDPGAWRPEGTEWRAALRVTPEEEYLSRELPTYRLGKVLEAIVPPDQRVLSLYPFQTIYHDRIVLDGEQSREGRRLREVVWAATLPRRQPIHEGQLTFAGVKDGSIRIHPRATEGTGRWGVNELTVRGRGIEQSIALTANPEAQDSPFAKDQNPTTRWTTGRTAQEDMWIELELESGEVADTIVVTGADDQFWPIQMEVRGVSPEAALEVSNAWQPYDSTFVAQDLAPDLATLFDGVRRELTRVGVFWIIGETTDDTIRLLLSHPDARGFVRRATETNLALVEVLPPEQTEPSGPR